MSVETSEYRRLRAQLHALRGALSASLARVEEVGTDADRARNRIDVEERLDRVGRLLERAMGLIDAPLGRLDAVLEAHAVDGECGHCGRKERRRHA